MTIWKSLHVLATFAPSFGNYSQVGLWAIQEQYLWTKTTYHASESGERGRAHGFLDCEAEEKFSPACDIKAHVGELDAFVVGCHAELVRTVDFDGGHLESNSASSKGATVRDHACRTVD